jgi:hypothetical protein
MLTTRVGALVNGTLPERGARPHLFFPQPDRDTA